MVVGGGRVEGRQPAMEARRRFSTMVDGLHGGAGLVADVQEELEKYGRSNTV